MSPTREELSAYIDGELDPSEMARMAVQVENSAELQRYVLNQERLLENLHAAFATLMNEPVPERLLRTATTAPISVRLQLREWFFHRGSLRSGSVLRFVVPATALALGLFVGIGVERQTDRVPDFIASPTTGQVVAQAELARALDTQLASEPVSGGPRIGVSFRTKDGDVCRTFEVAGAASSTDGLACHHSGEWQIGSLVSGAKSSAGTTYQLAGSETPAAIRDAVSSQISGLPFDAATERHERDSGWK